LRNESEQEKVDFPCNTYLSPKYSTQKMNKTQQLLLSCCLLSGSAAAQFTGCYAAANWTVNNANTNGSIYTTLNYFDLIADTDGGGNGTSGLDCSTTNNGNVSTCISVPASGTIQFNWTWTGGNNSTLLTEPFGYCLNGVPFDLTANVNYTGTANVPVTLGDQFCFVVSSQLANSHPTLFTHININQFSGPCVPAGMQPVSAVQVKAVSPFDNELVLKGTQSGSKLVVFDSMGRQVRSAEAADSETRIATEDLERGIYFIHCSLGAGLAVIRVVKM
jgi:hypothetical protein